MDQSREIAVFGGGCFWCTEAVFRRLKGVISVMPGYSGGQTINPTYEEVSAGTTGHAEVITFEYDPRVISFDDLLNVFFATHDPTTINRQGNDVGPQYRSVIFYSTPEQRDTAERKVAELNASSAMGGSIVTEVRSLKAFYPAEDYHQKYYEHHRDAAYCQLVINPKLQKVQEKFGDLLRESGIS